MVFYMVLFMAFFVFVGTEKTKKRGSEGGGRWPGMGGRGWVAGAGGGTARHYGGGAVGEGARRLLV